MDPLILRRIVWVVHRGHLRHGVLMWANLVVVLALLALAANVAASTLRLQRAAGEVAAARPLILHGTPVAAAVPGGREPLPLPPTARRFEITQRILQELQGNDFAPGQISFKFEHVADSGVTRQIAVFTVRTHWDEVAGLLAKLQAVDRSIYIARLRVARETVHDSTVDADIQLALAMRDDNPTTPVAP